jgi:GTP-binding protein
LEAYDPLLQEKTQLVALNKIDLPLVRERATDIENQFERMGYRLYLISGQTGEGVKELMEAVFLIFESISDQGHG